MASILDLGLLQFFSVVFPAILAFVVVYALLEKTNILGEKKRAINGLVAVTAAIFVGMSQPIIAIITFVAPWFVVLFLIIMIFIFAFRIVGYSDSEISEVLNHKQYGAGFFWVIIAACALIVFAGIGATFGSDLVGLTGDIQDDGQLDNPESPELNEFEENIVKTIVHPKVIGAAIFLIICVLAVAMLTGSP